MISKDVNIKKKNISGVACIFHPDPFLGTYAVAGESTMIPFKKCGIGTSGETGSLVKADNGYTTLGIVGVACSFCKYAKLPTKEGGCAAVCKEAL